MLSRIKNYRFNWKISVFTLVFFPILLLLGFWQLEREQEKLELQTLYESRQGAETVSLSSVNVEDDLQYVPVKFSGSFDNEHSFLLDNKIFEGKVGFEVLTPFITSEGELVVVNRGWIPQNAYREILPSIESVAEDIEVQGSIYIPLGEQFMLGQDANSDSWPRLIQRLNINSMASALNTNFNIFPYSVRLAPFQSGVYVRNWPVISTTPEKHRGYAVQWFTMATVLLLLYFFVSTKTDVIAASSHNDKGDKKLG